MKPTCWVACLVVLLLADDEWRRQPARPGRPLTAQKTVPQRGGSPPGSGSIGAETSS